MKVVALTLVLGGLMLAGDFALAQDRAAGRKVAGMCRTCHGLDGVARIPIAPHIGGEPSDYLENQLRSFRDGTREHEMMSVVARGLTDDQIANVSAWYAGHRVEVSAPDTAAAPETCLGCHGADGLGLAEDVPHLAGEASLYIDTQLKAFKRGKRVHDIMSGIAAELSDSEIRAIANYFADVKITVTQVDP